MIFELSYFAAQFDSSSIRVFFFLFHSSIASLYSSHYFFSFSFFLFLYSQASVDLSIHLEQMDIRNGSTLSNVAFPFHQHIRLLAHSQRFHFFFPLSIFSFAHTSPFSIRHPYTPRTRPNCVNVAFNVKRVFIVFPSLRWIAMKWKRTDWWIEMSAKNEIALRKPAVSCLMLLEFCFFLQFWWWSFLYVYRKMGTDIVRRWLLRTFHVLLLENRIDLNFNELQFKSKEPLWIVVKSEVTAIKAIDDQMDDGVWKCCYCFLPPLMVLTFLCRCCACIFCVRQFFQFVTHVNKLDYFSGVDSCFQRSCGEHSKSILWARLVILRNLFAWKRL